MIRGLYNTKSDRINIDRSEIKYYEVSGNNSSMAIGFSELLGSDFVATVYTTVNKNNVFIHSYNTKEFDTGVEYVVYDKRLLSKIYNLKTSNSSTIRTSRGVLLPHLGAATILPNVSNTNITECYPVHNDNNYVGHMLYGGKLYSSNITLSDQTSNMDHLTIDILELKPLVKTDKDNILVAKESVTFNEIMIDNWYNSEVDITDDHAVVDFDSEKFGSNIILESTESENSNAGLAYVGNNVYDMYSYEFNEEKQGLCIAGFNIPGNRKIEIVEENSGDVYLEIKDSDTVVVHITGEFMETGIPVTK